MTTSVNPTRYLKQHNTLFAHKLIASTMWRVRYDKIRLAPSLREETYNIVYPMKIPSLVCPRYSLSGYVRDKNA